ncbi:MAG: methyltransferase domain-containing protein [Candidatus Hydrogenedentes bacterium]|nr:methyltransferase domain-containing protein [Candidatus Hydrogenedentota bacterium]
MDRRVFDAFRSLVYERSGITLGENKEALVSARVGKRMRALGISEFKDYLSVVTEDTKGEEIVQLLDAISTNVTSFFRESAHFDFLRSLITGWKSQGQNRFRIWSAASSTGEEPYTIAMTLLDSGNRRNLDFKILATDISTRVLEHCVAGNYDQEKVAGIPRPMLDRYFDAIRHGDRTVYSAKNSLRNLLTFRRLNLSTPPFPMRGPLDCVFCRNVMIYFDNEVRTRLLNEVYRLLKPGGYLFVGHAESLTGIVSDFQTVRPAIYTKRG